MVFCDKKRIHVNTANKPRKQELTKHTRNARRGSGESNLVRRRARVVVRAGGNGTGAEAASRGLGWGGKRRRDRRTTRWRKTRIVMKAATAKKRKRVGRSINCLRNWVAEVGTEQRLTSGTPCRRGTIQGDARSACTASAHAALACRAVRGVERLRWRVAGRRSLKRGSAEVWHGKVQVWARRISRRTWGNSGCCCEGRMGSHRLAGARELTDRVNDGSLAKEGGEKERRTVRCEGEGHLL